MIRSGESGIVILGAVEMCLLRCSLLIICVLILDVHALTCRTDGGPKESELKNIYTKCLKMQDGKNSSRDSGDQDLKENRRNQRNDWEGSQSDRGRKDSKSGSRNERRDMDDRMGSSDDRMSSQNDRMGSYDERSDSFDRMGGRDGRMGSDRRSESSRRDDSMGNTRYGKEDNTNVRNEYQHDFGNDFSDPYGYQSTQSSRRYKRERKSENSGNRSQFNPNSKRYQDSNHSDENNSSEKNTSKDDEKKACALHCFLENLEMTAEDGMPDRYLVTHALTKDVNNEDLKDFLQESIEECFKILDNENTEDKCEFSKNLLVCLTEKGRENCDDWKEGLKF